MNPLFTIGHSTHESVKFIALLTMNNIETVADVRSSPFSRYSPQFNREILTAQLKSAGIEYVFLGVELGARSPDPNCYIDDQVQYSLIANTPAFKRGIERVVSGLSKRRISLLCAEKDPITCHRTILVCREIRNVQSDIQHIREDGSIERNEETERRLLQFFRLSEDLFETPETLLQRAYDEQAKRIAFNRIATGESILRDQAEL